MIKIDKAIIVEGKYDKIKLSSVIDAVIVETDGFAVFKDKEKQRLIRRLADTKGIVVLTDSDSAGFKIRSFIGGSVPQDRIINAYIPDIYGKEKRKDAPSKEGKLGVEGVPVQVIKDALTKAGVICVDTEKPTDAMQITHTDLYEDGVSGRSSSKKLRAELIRELDLPERISASQLLSLMNIFITYDEYKVLVNKCKEKIKSE